MVLPMALSLLFLVLEEVSESLAGEKDGTVEETKHSFEQHGLDASLFPRGDFGTAEIDPLLMWWETVRPGLENLLQEGFKLTARPDLSLHFPWVIAEHPQKSSSHPAILDALRQTWRRLAAAHVQGFHFLIVCASCPTSCRSSLQSSHSRISERSRASWLRSENDIY